MRPIMETGVTSCVTLLKQLLSFICRCVLDKLSISYDVRCSKCSKYGLALICKMAWNCLFLAQPYAVKTHSLVLETPSVLLLVW